MITYHFAVHSKRAGIEDLGFMTLANDSEAITFGEQPAVFSLRCRRRAFSAATARSYS